jgi:tripartite-type tricarboxylate transporter receptor subunit TctC
MFQITGMPSSWPHVETGKMRAVAVASAKRLASAPHLPTVSESGLPGYEANSWAGMLAPAGMPGPMIDKLNREVMRILKTPEVKKQLLKLGFEVMGSSPEQFGMYLKSEIAKWGKVIREANVRVD